MFSVKGLLRREVDSPSDARPSWHSGHSFLPSFLCLLLAISFSFSKHFRSLGLALFLASSSACTLQLSALALLCFCIFFRADTSQLVFYSVGGGSSRSRGWLKKQKGVAAVHTRYDLLDKAFCEALANLRGLRENMSIKEGVLSIWEGRIGGLWSWWWALIFSD